MALSGKAEKFSFPRRNSNSNFSSKRNGARNFSDVQSDIGISVDGVNFSLHKFPLLSRSGRLRRLLAEELSETSDEGASAVIEFSNFPGGPDAFELAAMFCYGLTVEVSKANVAQLRCAAEYLEMTEDVGDDNLVSRTEAFLQEVVLDSLEKSVEVLRSCEDALMPLAEELKVISRCIDAVASRACREQAVAARLVECNSSGRGVHDVDAGAGPAALVVEWWADDLAELRIDLYQRVLAAMKSRGLRRESVAGALMHYALKALKPLHFILKPGPAVPTAKSRYRINGHAAPPDAATWTALGSKAMEHEQRILLESIVSMLPAERNMLPTRFLLGLLRAAIVLDTTIACRLDLERRAGAQLEGASADDLLLPAYGSGENGMLYDVELVQRVLTAYMQQQGERGLEGDNMSSSTNHNLNATGTANHPRLHEHGQYELDAFGCSPASNGGGGGGAGGTHKGILKVAKLLDMYLAQVAVDPHLKAPTFIALAELLPDYSRSVDDGLYRAVDIFLKAHPSLPDVERKKLCKLLDCQKLSREACTHAAQNERLPVHLVVQVLYFEQLRMRNAMVITGDHLSPSAEEEGMQAHRPPRRLSGLTSSPRMVEPAMANLRRDNRELKAEVARLRLRVNDLEKENTSLKQALGKPPALGSPAASHPGFFSYVSRRFGKMGFFSSSSSRSPREAGQGKRGAGRDSKSTPRRRRHSIS